MTKFKIGLGVIALSTSCLIGNDHIQADEHSFSNNENDLVVLNQNNFEALQDLLIKML